MVIPTVPSARWEAVIPVTRNIKVMSLLDWKIWSEYTWWPEVCFALHWCGTQAYCWGTCLACAQIPSMTLSFINLCLGQRILRLQCLISGKKKNHRIEINEASAVISSLHGQMHFMIPRYFKYLHYRYFIVTLCWWYILRFIIIPIIKREEIMQIQNNNWRWDNELWMWKSAISVTYVYRYIAL